MGEPDTPRVVEVRETYEQLIRSGTYSEQFEHDKAQRAFFESVIGVCVERLPQNAAVLEAGCGTGVWLSAVRELLRERSSGASLHGFDLTAGMVALVKTRLGSEVVVWQGNVLDDRAYEGARESPYDMVFAYDVVQQLPRHDQERAIRVMLAHVDARGGTLVVFDHDARSTYGRLMAARKLLTRCGIPLVPRFYLTARYPRLASLAHALARDSALRVEVQAAPDGRKRALTITRVQGD